MAKDERDDEGDLLRDFVISMGGSLDEILKAAAIDARDIRNANRSEELAIQKLRETTDAAIAEANRILGTRRADIQQENYARTGEERRLRREAQTQRTLADQAQRAQAQMYRQQRDAQRQAYREQMDAERRQRREQAAQTPQSFSAPSFSRPGQGVVPSGGTGPDRAAVAKFIVLVTALAALGTLINSATGKAPTTVQTINGVKIPAHLRSLGGTFIAGTIALVVNEVYPAAGMVLGAGIVGLIVIPAWGPALTKVGALSFTGIPTALPPKGYAANQAPGASTNQQSQNWIQAHPGQWPNPGKGISDFWNGAAKVWADKNHIPMIGNP